MSVAGAESGKTGLHADVGGGLVDSETEAGHAVLGVGEGDGRSEGEFRRHVCVGGGGSSVGVVVGFGGGATLVCCLVLGGKGLVVRGEMADGG